MDLNIDDEWENFISQTGCFSDDTSEMDKTDIHKTEGCLNENLNHDTPPTATNIYISTKTKISYLNTSIDLRELFWNIKIMSYSTPCNGIIKKQMKFNSLSIEELQFIQEKLQHENYYEENIITHIDNPLGRIKFKDTRKVSIGISRKDILSYRSKKKSAFYNCFVLIMRIKIEGTFKEFHVKVFNTGKLEIPGVQNENVFTMILQQLLETLQPHCKTPLFYNDCNENVLINSNFNCGFYINRDILYETLKKKYNIHSIYDPCSYPGIQCKFYYNPEINIQSGSQISEENKHLYKNVKEVSFMIFRTGSVLIVGRCDEDVLMIIYEFIKNILTTEYKKICQKNITTVEKKDKSKKIRRKNILIENVENV
jgi:hypothetical protein